MATVLKETVDIDGFAKKVRVLARAQYDSPQYKRILEIPLNKERARIFTLQKAHWTVNRRDCWGFAQGLAPMDVKKLIWAHEEDELIGNKTRGVDDHFSLKVRQSELIGLRPEDFVNNPMREGTRTCIYAWVHLVKDSHWLTSVAACTALEVRNSSEWVEEGGMSYRMGKRLEKELGIPFEKQVSATEHSAVDVEHAHMLMQIAMRHGTTSEKLDLIMQGLTESWEIDRVWHGQLADMMAELPGPA